VNDRIRSPEVRLVGADGQQIGIVSVQDALRRAQDLDLDLVEVAPNADPPVCRIMDYGKFKYERDVRQKEARKKQSRIEVKEIKMRPKIDPHDYGTKKGHIERFLKQGARVKITIMFRGREMAHTEMGRRKLDQLTEDLRELGTVETFPKLDGRNMTMVVAPVKRAAAKEHREEGSEPGPGPGGPGPTPMASPAGMRASGSGPGTGQSGPTAQR
jgi:translation initiation factor IF-3